MAALRSAGDLTVLSLSDIPLGIPGANVLQFCNRIIGLGVAGDTPPPDFPTTEFAFGHLNMRFALKNPFGKRKTAVFAHRHTPLGP